MLKGTTRGDIPGLAGKMTLTDFPAGDTDPLSESGMAVVSGARGYFTPRIRYAIRITFHAGNSTIHVSVSSPSGSLLGKDIGI